MRGGMRMEEKIRVFYGNDEEGTTEILNKLGAEQKILEVFETKEIESIEIIYKKRELACEANSKN